MEQDIRDALTDLKTQVRDGFAQTNQRIADLVTIGEFRATVERVDAQHATLRRDFEVHKAETPSIVQASESRDEAIRQEFRSELEGFRATTRWAVGIAATAVGLVCTIASVIINTLP